MSDMKGMSFMTVSNDISLSIWRINWKRRYRRQRWNKY